MTAKTNPSVGNESAYEIITADRKKEEEEAKKEKAKAQKKSSKKTTFLGKTANSTASIIGRELGKSATRGLLGVLKNLFK